MAQQTADPSRTPHSLMFRVRASLRHAWEKRGCIGCGVLAAFVAYLALRGCVPALGGSRLPAVLESEVTHAYEHCEQDFPIWPVEVRMPTCDTIAIRYAGSGTVPESSRGQGITRAMCYHVEVEHMFWGVSGGQKHEMAWSLRTYSKVAVLRDGGWVLFPDEDEADRARWAEYACPGGYAASSGLVPR